MTRLLCVGDLHLEAGGDYCRHPGQRLDEQMQVWARALEISREMKCDAVLLAGDAFHKAKPSPEAMLAFERPILALRETLGVTAPRIVAIPGNHDYASADAGLGLEVFGEAGLLTLARTPQVVHVAGVDVACLPWAPVGRIVAQAGGGDRDELHRAAAETLLTVARGLRAQVDGPCVLLTHFSISGAVTPDGADVGLFREPVLVAGDLDAVGFEAIVAGHIHKPQTIASGHGFYTGSPMPLSFGEAKSDHGVWILDIDADAVSASFVPIESRRLITLDLALDAMEADGIDALRELNDALGDPDVWRAGRSDVTDAVVKVRITATAEQARRLDIGAIKRTLIDAGAHKVWAVQTDVTRDDRARVDGLDETLSELDALDLYLTAQNINGDRGARLRARTATYLQEIQ